ncbi:TPA: RHS repeat protein [Escherichia coli]|nr:RHS repeat protein [Escherichia coli]
MSGKPAARQGDMTQYGGPIVQGSAGVRIGAPTGVACSVCPGGMTSGNPVNPLLGAKVQPGETDLALPDPLPFILSRTYSSYRTKTPAPVGIFGPGWKAPSDIRLQLRDDGLILNDNGGRSIHFEPLLPGEAVYSRSESMWLVRGGKAAQPDGHTLARLWGALPPDIRLSPHLYLATNSAQGPWWILGWSERVPGAEDLLPAPLPPYRVLTGMADRFGRTLAYRREAAGDLAGEITGVTDGAGREFRLVLTTQAQRAEEARKPHTASLSSPDSPRPLSAPSFPDTLPGTEYGTDSGIRLSAVWLMHDPEYPENLPAAPLVCYDWTPRGELAAVYDRSGTQMRHFTYDDKYRGRMVGHRYAGRPEMRYRYDDAGRVVEQLNPAGLSYRYQYEQDRITVTDSLNRREVLHTEGGAGLKRVVKKELADGSVTHSGYDAAGRLTAQTDAAGRRTEYGLNVVSGDITVSTTQGGLTRSMEYDAAGRVISLTNENGSHSDFSYDALDRLVQQGGFDGRTQRYHYDLTGKLTQSEDEGLVTLWYYDESDRITHRTVNGEPAEQWQYDDHGWLTDISHLSEGHRVAVHYGYDDKGRLTGERQTVENPETGELLWQHETKHAYNEQGLANRVTPDSLPPVEWLTYGSGYLAGMKLGGTPLVEYTRDRLHRETVRSFGSMAGSNAAYELTSTYTPAGQLQSQHLNSLVYDRDYGWNDNGDLVRISGPRQTREYGYSATGRLESVRTLAPDLDIRIPYATDPAGNRLPDPELHPDSTLTAWPDNRIAEDAHYVYHYDEYGRLTEKTDRIPTGVIRTDDERTHHYHYDSQHRLVFHTRIQHGEPLVESRYLYDPLGRRMAKRVWRRERDLTGWMSLSRKPEETWYGWDGDRLTTVQTDTTRIQTVYQPGSFAPLIRIETDNGEREKAQCRSLAEKLQQEGSEDGHGVVFPAELVGLLDRLEGEIRANCVSSESRQWLAQCGLTVERLAAQIEPVYLPERKIHLYHCDHRGLPLALISEDGNTAWSAEYDEWGNQLNEENPHHLHQPYRLPGQQYDKESGLYYNRNRYYDPLQGRYITQDPIGLEGGWSLYAYPLNPVNGIDPLGLSPADVALIRRKDQLNHQRAWDILSDTYEDMKRLNLGGTDQFFHCMAFCRVSKLNDAGVSRSAKGLGYEKEIRDYGLNLFGMYGRKVKLSHSEMIEDNKKDLAVNDHGLTCPSTTDCSDRCSDYINPEHKKTIKALQDAGYLK